MNSHLFPVNQSIHRGDLRSGESKRGLQSHQRTDGTGGECHRPGFDWWPNSRRGGPVPSAGWLAVLPFRGRWALALVWWLLWPWICGGWLLEENCGVRGRFSGGGKRTVESGARRTVWDGGMWGIWLSGDWEVNGIWMVERCWWSVKMGFRRSWEISYAAKMFYRIKFFIKFVFWWKRKRNLLK